LARTLSDFGRRKNISVTDNPVDEHLQRQHGDHDGPYFGDAPLDSTVTELYVDPATLVARGAMEQGQRGADGGEHGCDPDLRLQVGGTYLIYSEVSYAFVPTVGYVLKKLDYAERLHLYPAPRQSTCVMYNTTVCTTT